MIHECKKYIRIHENYFALHYVKICGKKSPLPGANFIILLNKRIRVTQKGEYCCSRKEDAVEKHRQAYIT